MSRVRSAYVEAVGAGVVSGMRSFLMPALLGRALSTDSGTPSVHGAADLLRSRTLSKALTIASAGELVGDKLPAAPDRTELPSLAARAVSGAFGATVFASWNREPAMPAAALGMVGAIASAHLMMRLRRAAGRRLGVPDPVVALVEDVLAFAIGRTLISTVERQADR